MLVNQRQRVGMWTYGAAIQELDRLTDEAGMTDEGSTAAIMLALECRAWLSRVRYKERMKGANSWRN